MAALRPRRLCHCGRRFTPRTDRHVHCSLRCNRRAGHVRQVDRFREYDAARKRGPRSIVAVSLLTGDAFVPVPHRGCVVHRAWFYSGRCPECAREGRAA